MSLGLPPELILLIAGLLILAIWFVGVFHQDLKDKRDARKHIRRFHRQQKADQALKAQTLYELEDYARRKAERDQRYEERQRGRERNGGRAA